jgi:hypothetical protein
MVMVVALIYPLLMVSALLTHTVTLPFTRLKLAAWVVAVAEL